MTHEKLNKGVKTDMLHISLTDTETTGLEELMGHVLIEIAMRILVPPEPGGLEPRELARRRWLIRPDVGWAADANDFAVAMHNASGLLRDACDHGRPVTEVDDEVRAFIDEHVPESEKPWLMGNSVSFDARFIKKWMPKTHARLHYRQIDVTSITGFVELFTGTSPMDWDKNKAHTAEADLDETWHEARVYAHKLLGAQAPASE